MRQATPWLVVVLGLIAIPLSADEAEHHPAIVIDSDMGLDDAVTLAMALQNPDVAVVAVVASEGAASGGKSIEHLERMLGLFNRQEIPVYAPAATRAGRPPPAFRAFAEESVGGVLPASTERRARRFAPDAYVSERDKTVVLALGPLTNLATALDARPEIENGIARVIISGPPNVKENWNGAFDPDAWSAVQASGLPLEFVVPGPATRKPGAWRDGELRFRQGTSIGEGLVTRLLSQQRVRQHYTAELEMFHDELVFLYCVDDSLFSRPAARAVLVPSDHAGIVKLFCRLVSEGRQRKDRVVFAEDELPDLVLQPDLRARRARLIAKNGETEWFAQLLAGELHEHLGAYSVIGVKMGLRAAELLNAPQHTMHVVSYAPAEPPVSCLNDGVIVSTGSTPGRALFTHRPGPADSVSVSFAYNGRQLVLTFKEHYRARIRAEIAELGQRHTLEDEQYWHGIRRLALEIWENWHRRDLFELIDARPPAK